MKDIREAFEAWANSYWAQGLEENFRDDETGAYVESAVQDAWQAYKAAHEGAEAELRKAVGAQQAIIDRLMLEFCPNEMSVQQMGAWEAAQRVSKEFP